MVIFIIENFFLRINGDCFKIFFKDCNSWGIFFFCIVLINKLLVRVELVNKIYWLIRVLVWVLVGMVLVFFVK